MAEKTVRVEIKIGNRAKGAKAVIEVPANLLQLDNQEIALAGPDGRFTEQQLAFAKAARLVGSTFVRTYRTWADQG